MRILEIIGNGIVGGMERHVMNLVTSLPDRFAVTCLCPYESAFTRDLRAQGCAVHIAAMRDDPQWSAIETAVALIHRYEIDLIHAHLLNAHSLAVVAGSLSGRPVIATIHSRTLGPQEISVTRLTGSHVIVVCQEAWSHASAVGIPSDDLTLIPNGVDTDLFRPGSGIPFRDEIGVPHDALLVGFSGRLSPEKGPDKFVRVAERIHQHLPDVHFAIAGEGPLAGEIRGMTNNTSLGSRMHLVGLRQDMSAVYPAFDVFVQTSRTEAMPLAVLEAMACARPVVAIAVGGVAEVVEVGTTGLVVSPGDWPGVASAYPGDWEGIAACVIDLLGAPEERQRLGEAGRLRVEKLFDLQTSARRTATLFDELVSGKRGRRFRAPHEIGRRQSDADLGAVSQDARRRTQA